MACIAAPLAACRILTHHATRRQLLAPSQRFPRSSIVQPAMTDVQNCISALNISRWKAPGEVRSAAQQNTGSIQRDLRHASRDCLAKRMPPPQPCLLRLSVYRNIDALYDVLLRVYETASLAAPQGESDALFSSLKKLEAARSQLGDAILNASQQREDQFVKLQAAVRRRSGCTGSGVSAKDHGGRRWNRPTFTSQEKEKARRQTPGRPTLPPVHPAKPPEICRFPGNNPSPTGVKER